jgi:hypothetical protein
MLPVNALDRATYAQWGNTAPHAMHSRTQCL